MVLAYVGLGSNLDAPCAQIERGLNALAALPHSRLVHQSRLYRSVAWGRIDQPDFVNAAAALETTLAPEALLQNLLEIERRAGRIRDAVRWGPRVLDLDIISYGNQAIERPGLRIPHPRLAERAFVLAPLCEIAPELALPGLGRIDALLARIDASGCTPLEPGRATAE